MSFSIISPPSPSPPLYTRRHRGLRAHVEEVPRPLLQVGMRKNCPYCSNKWRHNIFACDHRCLIYLHYTLTPRSYSWHTYCSGLYHLNLSGCIICEICIFISTFAALSHRYFTHRHTWEDAEKDCREHSAHLSSIISATEQEFINGMFAFLSVRFGFILL